MDWQVKYAKDMLIEHVDRDKRRYGNISAIHIGKLSRKNSFQIKG